MRKISIYLIIVLSFLLSNCSSPDPKSGSNLVGSINRISKNSLLNPLQNRSINPKQECNYSVLYESCYDVGMAKKDKSVCGSFSVEIRKILAEKITDKGTLRYGEESCYIWCLQGITNRYRISKSSLCNNNIDKPVKHNVFREKTASVYKKNTKRYKCSNLTASEARHYYLAGHKYLDADNDGIPCEKDEKSSSKSNMWYKLLFSPSYSSGSSVNVRGYYRKDGTYVRPHRRRSH